MSKSYSKMSTAVSSSSKLGKQLPSSSSKAPSPLMSLSKKNYKKQSASKPDDFGTGNFGLTGLTGES
jgi:hypothetical protein